MLPHRDILDELNFNSPLRAKLRAIHAALKARVPAVDRVSVVLYDRKNDMLKTIADSSSADEPLAHYQARLHDTPSLYNIFKQGRPRLVPDLRVLGDGAHEHTRRLLDAGYRASYTLPMFSNGVFFGFVFFNSRAVDPFAAEALAEFDVFGHLVSLLVTSEVGVIDTLLAALRIARSVTRGRDTETGAHAERIARYARLIARGLAPRYGFDDEYIEHVFMFAPLHDIGKMAVPEGIMRKQAGLTDDEMALIRSHVRRGREIIDAIVRDFGLESVQYIDVLRNITEFHHEKVNGTGYPRGLVQSAIPIEARIVAVADVFDALTSQRHYKTPWTNDEAFAALERMAGVTLDPDCVAALSHYRGEIDEIQARFREPATDWNPE